MIATSRRKWLAAGLLGVSSQACRRESSAPAAGPTGERRAAPGEEYVWLSANTHLPLFAAHDHPALEQAGQVFGVKTTIAGPNGLDIPALVAAVEQTAARRPAGMLVVGWDPSALIPAINAAVDAGIPVVCIDADVPASKRLAFVGTDWRDIGVEQGRAMVAALAGRKGKVALLGLIEQHIDQVAFEGFRSIVASAGLQVLEPQHDKGNQAEAARVATAILQSHPDLVGMAGFDSESGPGIGLAVKESGRTGKIVATSVDAEQQHLELLREGALTALVMQKRELFTYLGVQALFDAVHSPIRFTSDDRKAGIWPIATNYNTGTITITRENLDLFWKA
jgi:ABC-type sugar transport system substrate-binding protein